MALNYRAEVFFKKTAFWNPNTAQNILMKSFFWGILILKYPIEQMELLPSGGGSKINVIEENSMSYFKKHVQCS